MRNFTKGNAPLRVALLLAWACASGTALAQSTGSADISNIRYQLLDLDLDDGIVPSLTFTTSTLDGATSASAASWFVSTVNPTSSSLLVDERAGSTAQGAVSVAKTHVLTDVTPNTTVTLAASVSGGPLAALSLQASATARDQAGRVESAVDARTGIIEFVLSPMTQVAFFADAAVDAAAGPLAAAGMAAAAYGSAAMVFYPNLGQQQDSTVAALERHANFVLGQGPGLSDTLFLEYSNGIPDISQHGVLFRVSATAYTAEVSPVPEPASYAMLLGGLGGLGMLALLQRRRRRPA